MSEAINLSGNFFKLGLEVANGLPKPATADTVNNQDSVFDEVKNDENRITKDDVKQQGAEALEEAAEFFSLLEDLGEQTIEDGKEFVSGKISDAKDFVTGTIDSAKEKVSDGIDAAKAKIGDIKEGVGDIKDGFSDIAQGLKKIF